MFIIASASSIYGFCYLSTCFCDRIINRSKSYQFDKLSQYDIITVIYLCVCVCARARTCVSVCICIYVCVYTYIYIYIYIRYIYIYKITCKRLWKHTSQSQIIEANIIANKRVACTQCHDEPETQEKMTYPANDMATDRKVCHEEKKTRLFGQTRNMVHKILGQKENRKTNLRQVYKN